MLLTDCESRRIPVIGLVSGVIHMCPGEMWDPHLVSSPRHYILILQTRGQQTRYINPLTAGAAYIRVFIVY